MRTAARPARRWAWILGGACSVALLSTASAAPSDQPSLLAPAGPTDEKDKKAPAVTEVNAEIIVLHGTNDGKGIDPAIGRIPELGEPPFSSYNSYKLLKKSNLKLPKGDAKSVDLPDKGKLSVVFKDVAKGKKSDDPLRYQLNASILKADGKSFLPGLDVSALKGKYFFIAGQKYEGGILVIGIKISG